MRVVYFHKFKKPDLPGQIEVGLQCLFIPDKEIVLYRQGVGSAAPSIRTDYLFATEGELFEQAKAIAEGRIKKVRDYHVIPDVKNATFCNVTEYDYGESWLQKLIENMKAKEEMVTKVEKEFIEILKNIGRH